MVKKELDNGDNLSLSSFEFSDEVIRDTFLRSRNYADVEQVLSTVQIMIAHLKDFKNGPQYSKKIKLRHYESELKKRLRYLSKEKSLREARKQLKVIKSKQVEQAVAEMIVSRAIKSARIEKAKDALLDIQRAELELQLSNNPVRSGESDKFLQDVQDWINKGVDPAEALRKVSRGIQVTKYTPLDFQEQQEQEQNQENQQEQSEIEPDANNLPGVDFDVLNEPGFTESNPIHLTEEPKKEEKEE